MEGRVAGFRNDAQAPKIVAGVTPTDRAGMPPASAPGGGETGHKQVPHDFGPQLTQLRRSFVEQVWKGLFLIALFVTPLSVLRARTTGWLPLYTLHLCLAAGVVVLVVFLARVPPAVQAGLLIGVLWAVGVPGVLTLGLAAGGIWWLILSCVVAGVAYSPRAGLLAAGAMALTIALAGVGFVSGVLKISIDLNKYVLQPSSWVLLLVGVSVLAFIVVTSIDRYNRSLVDLLQEIQRQRDEIELLATHDHLTGLPLIALADDRLRMAVHTARRHGTKVALLFIDVDGFKGVNDTFGHEAGDAVLREIAKRLVKSIRAEDTAARVGGDEFIVTLVGLTNTENALAVAQRILGTLSTPVLYGGTALVVGASIGIGLFPDHAEDLRVLRRLADEAMYVSKRAGKNRVSVARPALES